MQEIPRYRYTRYMKSNRGVIDINNNNDNRTTNSAYLPILAHSAERVSVAMAAAAAAAVIGRIRPLLRAPVPTRLHFRFAGRRRPGPDTRFPVNVNNSRPAAVPSRRRHPRSARLCTGAINFSPDEFRGRDVVPLPHPKTFRRRQTPRGRMQCSDDRLAHIQRVVIGNFYSVPVKRSTISYTCISGQRHVISLLLSIIKRAFVLLTKAVYTTFPLITGE